MTTLTIVQQLKKELKARSITYAEIGRRIKLSEAAVKRQFAENNFSLRRLDQICDAVGMDVFDLAQKASKQSSQPEVMPLSAENKLAKNPRLLICLYGLLQGYRPQKIKTLIDVGDSEYFLLLRQLEQEGLIEIYAGNRVKFLIAIDVRWNGDGPLAEMYSVAIRDEFFSSTFQSEFEFQDFITRRLSKSAFERFRRQLKKLFQELNELSERDSTFEEPGEVFWFYTGIRPWAPIKAVQRIAQKPKNSSRN